MTAGQWVPIVVIVSLLAAVAVVELAVRLVDRRDEPQLGTSARQRLLDEIDRQP